MSVPSSVESSILSDKAIDKGIQLPENIDHHTRAITTLPREMNRVLPPEILEQIFLVLRAGCRSYRWMRVTHVCHYWREVALQSARLWSYINLPCHNVAHAEELLRRSKETALSVVGDITHTVPGQLAHITVSSGRSSPYTIFEVIFRAFARMVTIELSGPPSDFDFSLVVTKLKEGSSKLRSVTLKHSNSEFGSMSLDPFPNCVRFPQLEVLKLTGFDVSLVLPLFPNTPNLRVLQITQFEDCGSMVSLLDMLRHLPHLQSLSLVYEKKHNDDHASGLPTTSSEVSLPQLKILDIELASACAIYLFTRLLFPSHCQVKVSMDSSLFAPSPDRLLDVASSIVACVMGPRIIGDPIPLVSAYISPDSLRQVRLLAWTEGIELDDIEAFGRTKTISKIRCSPKLDVTAISSQSVEILIALFRAMMLSDIEELFITWLDFIESRVWLCIMEGLPNLKRLVIVYTRTGILPDILGSITESGILLPALQSVHLHRGTFWNPEANIEPTLTREALGESLLKRKQHGAMLKRLRVTMAAYLAEPKEWNELVEELEYTTRDVQLRYLGRRRS